MSRFRTNRLSRLNQNVLVSPAGHLPYKAAASVECTGRAAVVRQGEETATIGMAVGRKGLLMPSVTSTRWRKMLAIAEALRRPDQPEQGIPVCTTSVDCALLNRLESGQ